MKPLLPAILILALSAPAALADDCADRMAEILKGSSGREKTMAVITTEMKGQKPTGDKADAHQTKRRLQPPKEMK